MTTADDLRKIFRECGLQRGWFLHEFEVICAILSPSRWEKVRNMSNSSFTSSRTTQQHLHFPAIAVGSNFSDPEHETNDSESPVTKSDQTEGSPFSPIDIKWSVNVTRRRNRRGNRSSTIKINEDLIDGIESDNEKEAACKKLDFAHQNIPSILQDGLSMVEEHDFELEEVASKLCDMAIVPLVLNPKDEPRTTHYLDHNRDHDTVDSHPPRPNYFEKNHISHDNASHIEAKTEEAQSEPFANDHDRDGKSDEESSDDGVDEQIPRVVDAFECEAQDSSSRDDSAESEPGNERPPPMSEHVLQGRDFRERRRRRSSQPGLASLESEESDESGTGARRSIVSRMASWEKGDLEVDDECGGASQDNCAGTDVPPTDHYFRGTPLRKKKCIILESEDESATGSEHESEEGSDPGSPKVIGPETLASPNAIASVVLSVSEDTGTDYAQASLMCEKDKAVGEPTPARKKKRILLDDSLLDDSAVDLTPDDFLPALATPAQPSHGPASYRITPHGCATAAGYACQSDSNSSDGDGDSFEVQPLPPTNTRRKTKGIFLSEEDNVQLDAGNSHSNDEDDEDVRGTLQLCRVLLRKENMPWTDNIARRSSNASPPRSKSGTSLRRQLDHVTNLLDSLDFKNSPEAPKRDDRSRQKRPATACKASQGHTGRFASFRLNRDKFTKALFSELNSKVFDKQLPADMEVKWNVRLNRTAGMCYSSRDRLSGERKARIELSDKVLDSWEKLKQTLCHEMCHAAVLSTISATLAFHHLPLGLARERNIQATAWQTLQIVVLPCSLDALLQITSLEPSTTKVAFTGPFEAIKWTHL